MARRKFEKTFNTFVGGLNTEASELNFPENTSLHDKNFLLRTDGGRDRRKGMGLVGPLGLTLTSGLYPLEFDDGIAPGMVEPSARWNVWPVESVGVGILPPAVYRRAAVRYREYKNGEPESIGVGLVAPSVKRIQEVIPIYHEAFSGPEAIGIGLLPPAVFREKVADRFEYRTPEESISVGLLAPAIKRTNI